jgi:hypothetical protein
LTCATDALHNDGWDADIVIMAFGWEQRNRKRYPAFEDKLSKVTMPAKPPLFFAAASNGGALIARTYPAREAGVFAIHACDHQGDNPGYNPTSWEGKKNYATIGHDVPGYNPDSREQGTSFAVPVAAGFAAAVIGLVRLQCQRDEKHCKKWTKEWLGLLQSFNGMKKVFDAVARRRGDYDLLEWWELFAEEKSNGEVCDEIWKALRE